MLYRYAHTTMRGALALLATGAIADQTTRWFSTSPTLLLVVWAALLIGLWVLTTRPSVEGSFAVASLSPTANNIALIVGVVTAGTAFVLNSSHNQAMNRLAVAVALLLISGSIAALQTAHHAEQASIGRYHHWWKKRDSAVLGACMAFVAAASDMTYRAITDDHYYVNLSTYIYDRGIIPTRDTVLSDQVFRGAPRFSSWEVLWGTLARLVHVPPAYLLYLVFIPLAAALSVVALAHLIDTAGITRYKEALVAGSIFIVFDGASAFSFGAYQGPRIWEGKSFLLAVIVPLVFSYAIRLVRNPTPRTRIDMAILVIAAMGASTTTFIVVTPVLAAALLLTLRHRRIEPVLLGSLTYIAVCALVFREISHRGQSGSGGLGAAAHVPTVTYTNPSGTPHTYDILTKISHPSWHAALFALVICWGWIGLPGRVTRELVALCVGAFGLMSLPGILPVLLDVSGATSIAWRLLWVVPIPLLVAATAGYLTEIAGTTNRNQKLTGLGSFGVFTAALAVLPLVVGTPPWGNARGTKMEASLAKPFTMRVGFGYPQAARALDAIGHDGDIVLARNGLSASINALTPQYFTVAVRPTYVTAVTRGFPDGFAQQRVALAHYVTGDQPVTWGAGELAAALAAVRVNVVCITSDFSDQIAEFKSLGYSVTEKTVKRDSHMSVWCGRTSAFDAS